jgi:plastocyanin
MTRRSTVAILATAALGVSATAGTALAQGGSAPTIAAKGKTEKGLKFAPRTITVTSGSKVTFTNKSVAPHTFSLIQRSLLPKTGKQVKACGELKPGSACAPLVKAHKVNLKNFHIGRKLFDAGKDGGFATEGDATKAGDSVYLDPGKSRTVKITAPAGTTLTYFCAIHPFMNGKIKVK